MVNENDKNMKAVFTVSSPDYLGYSISLYKSLIEYNPDVIFYIGLLPSNKQLDLTKINKSIRIVTVLDTSYEKIFHDLTKTIPINKVCMAFKPVFGKEIFKLNEKIEKLIYLDSDILVFNSLYNIWNDLEKNSIVLSPHLINPLKEDKENIELRMLSRNGVFNTGFFAVKKDNEAIKFLDWWFSKLIKFGLFGDQLWLNFAPTLFNVKVSKHSGINVAFYNLPNRIITFDKESNSYLVNKEHKLIFFHFIKHNPFKQPNLISTARLIQPQLTFSNFPELKPIFLKYKESLTNSNFEYFKKFKIKALENTWFRSKIIKHKNSTIRLLYKLIFEIVNLK